MVLLRTLSSLVHLNYTFDHSQLPHSFVPTFILKPKEIMMKIRMVVCTVIITTRVLLCYYRNDHYVNFTEANNNNYGVVSLGFSFF